jgi:coenzyme F420-reducing hydrogenase gamma subunit
MKGNTTMSNAKNTNVTPADVVAKATEEKLITTVPAQAEEVDVDARTCESQVDESPELTVIEGGKKSLKERLAVVTEKLKENKKVLITVGAAAGVAALAFAKYAKKKAEEALAVEPLDEAEGPVIGVDDSAA